MKFYKALIFSLCLSSMAEANIPERFPSYSFVLTNFNVDQNYIHNAEFKRFVQKYEHRYRKYFSLAMKNGRYIIPTIKHQLIERGLSPMFLYLSLAESSFKPWAVSSSKAIGLWQFKRGAGMDQKLTMNHVVDERYDPIRSTEAAMGYLSVQNEGFDRWYLAAMSYNWGKGNVKKAIARAGTKDLSVLMDPRRGLVRKETRDYIHKILLFAMIGENYLFNSRDSFGKMVPTSEHEKLVPVKVRNNERLERVARVLNINLNVLKSNNLHLRKGYVPNQKFSVNIPESKLQTYYQHYRR